MFRAGKGNYKAILRELARVTGKPWRDLPAEIKQRRAQMEQDRRNARLIVIDRPVEAGGVSLNPGTYRVAVRERDGNLGEAFFYANDSKTSYPVAQAIVELREPPRKVGSPEATYATDEDGVVTLAEILMPQQAFRLVPPRPPGEPASTLRRFYAGLGWWLVVRREEIQEETAGVATLAHLHDSDSGGRNACHGKLYITPTRVIFDGNAGQFGERHDFSVARSAVGDSWLRDGYLRLDVHRVYVFNPIHERGADGGPSVPDMNSVDPRQRGRAEKEFARFLGELIQVFDLKEGVKRELR